MSCFEDDSSSSERSNLKPIVKEVKFQLLVPIAHDERVLNGLVLPRIFRNQIGKDCRSISLVDSRNKEFPVMVKEYGAGYPQLCELRWPTFVRLNVLGDLPSRTLCFRLLKKDVVQVICFNEFGVELIRNDEGKLMMKCCLMKGTDRVIHEQYLPSQLLEDLNEKSPLKPSWRASITGPRQDGEVGVIYKFHKQNRELVKWRAVGFQGKKWTNFVNENRVDSGFALIFTNMGNRGYAVDVFTEDGIGIGYESFSKNETIEWVNVDPEDEESDDDKVHECRVSAHKHKRSEPYFLITLPNHCLRTKMVTVPKPFVAKHQLYTYAGEKTVVLLFGKLQFEADLKIKKDSRRPNDLTHVVIMFDWSSFSKATGVMVGDPIRFELNTGNSVPGIRVQFLLC